MATVLATMFPEVAPERLHSYVAKFTRHVLGSNYHWLRAQISLHIGNRDLDREHVLQLAVVQCRAWTEGDGRLRRERPQ